MPVRLTPARFIAVVSGILTLYSLARVGVLFFEALSIVRAERSEDYELLEVCQSGQARGSAKMREACLKARAELASPIVFKAIVHAVSTAFKDFSDTVGSPFKLMVLVLFLLSSVVLPVIPWAKMLFGQHVHEPVQPMNGIHYIQYADARPYNHGRFRRKMGKAMQRLRLRRTPQIEEVGGSGSDDDVEPGNGQHHHHVDMPNFTSTKTGEPVTSPRGWMNVDLFNPGGRPTSPTNGHEKYE